jgi:hypothetical protein
LATKKLATADKACFTVYKHSTWYDNVSICVSCQAIPNLDFWQDLPSKIKVPSHQLQFYLELQFSMSFYMDILCKLHQCAMFYSWSHCIIGDYVEFFSNAYIIPIHDHMERWSAKLS